MKPPTGQKLADAMAEMMGWKLADRRLQGWGDGPKVWITGLGEKSGMPTFQGFAPHLDYNQCRIVEDWIWENGLWDYFVEALEVEFDIYNLLKSTSLQRCTAAWMAWQESKKGNK